jgi:phosphate transport system substrate-binding protein
MLSSNFSRLGALTAAVVFAALPIGCSKKPAATSDPAATDNKPAASEPASNSTGAAVTLSGAGATFPQPLYERYSKEIKKDLPQLKINYQGIGSGGGVKQTISRTVDFGASDAAMTDEEIGKVAGGVLMIPTAGGAVSVVYNLAGVENLKLSNAVLAGIFTGKIKTWNDPQIAKDNPGAKLPTSGIKPAVRADGSGTSFIFSSHVSSIDPAFKTAVGANKEPKWPAGFLKGKGNPGVASLVKQTPGSIGYVEYEVALKNKLTAASVQNGSGAYVVPSPQTANEALADIKFPENFRVFGVNSPKGYPIVGLTWLLIPKTQKDPAKAKATKEMVKWILTNGQKFNTELNYTSIPTSVATRAIAAVETGVK